MDYVPQVTWDDVVRVVKREFPTEGPKSVLSILGRYGAGQFHRERNRVHLAILKLSAEDLQKVRQYVTIAERDYRDVIAPAEYPRFWEIGFVGVAHMSPESKERLQRDDWEQHESWLRAE